MNGKDIAWVPMEHQEYSTHGLIGYPGNPFVATAEKGKKLIYAKAKLMTEFINEVKKFKVEVKNREYWNRTYRPF
jgi:creatinine amidohydrolase/Fe(II)-dependent formamide hydrolase-like protein